MLGAEQGTFRVIAEASPSSSGGIYRPKSAFDHDLRVIELPVYDSEQRKYLGEFCLWGWKFSSYLPAAPPAFNLIIRRRKDGKWDGDASRGPPRIIVGLCLRGPH